MKLNYQLLKQLILEQLEAQTSDSLAELRGLAYDIAKNPEAEDIIRAYNIYKGAKGKDKDLIRDYYIERIDTPLDIVQALKDPEVLIMSNHVRRVGNVGDSKTYEEIDLYTLYRKPEGGYDEGVPLGKIKIYIYNNEFNFKGKFLGDEEFNEDEKLKLPSKIISLLNRRGVGDITHEYYDHLNDVLDNYIKGEGKEKYENYIINYLKGENK